jgi:ABC-type multidrug transport system ATPase subunit
LRPPDHGIHPQIKKVNAMATEEKVVLVVGETGAGKTTLINGLANFVCGVNWNDNFRFKVGFTIRRKRRDSDIVDLR